MERDSNFMTSEISAYKVQVAPQPLEDPVSCTDDQQQNHLQSNSEQGTAKRLADADAEGALVNAKRPRIEPHESESRGASEPKDDRTSAGDSISEEAGFEDDEQGSAVDRVLSDEQAAADLAAIRGMWELAAVYEFMATFKHWLNFTQLYPLTDLEEAIVRSPGPGLLAQLHVDLLRGIATRSQVGQNNWTSTLSARLLSEAAAAHAPLASLPFRPVRGKEARDYAALSAVDRVLTLKALSDMRADREDMRTLVDDIMRGALAPPDKQGGRAGSGAGTPPRRSGRGGGPPPPPPYTPEDMRGRKPLGQDADGNSYHWFDLPYDHDAPVGLLGSRLYVEGPPQQPDTQLQQQQVADKEQQQLEGVQAKTEGVKQETPDAADAGGDAAAAAGGKLHGKPPLPPARPGANVGPGGDAGAACNSPTAPDSIPQQQQQVQVKPEPHTAADSSPAQAADQQQQPEADGKDADPPAAAAEKHKGDRQVAPAEKEGGQQQQQQQQAAEAQPEPAADQPPAAAAAGAAAKATAKSAAARTGKVKKAAVPAAAAAADSSRHDPVGVAESDADAAVDAADDADEEPHCWQQGADASAKPAAVEGASKGKGGRGRSSSQVGSVSSKGADKGSSKAVGGNAGAPARPGRKAAAAASAKFAQQLSGTKAEHSATSETSDSGRPAAAAAGGSGVKSKKGAAGSKPPRGRGSSRLSITSGADDGPPTAADAADAAGTTSGGKSGRQQSPGSGRKRARSPSQPVDDAAMAQLLSTARPTRRAAADAAAKIAVQYQNISITKLAIEAAAKEAAEAAAAGVGSSKASKGSRKAAGAAAAGAGSSGRSVKKQRLKGPYVLPPDEVGGSWRLAADDIETVQSLGEALSASDRPKDVEMGQLLLQQVVATLMERKQQEERYARARSRVAKSLGLDAPIVAPRERAARQRKVVRYDFDDYDRHIRTAIRASERLAAAEEPEAPGRQPYSAPAYDIDVRRGRSGGPLEDVEMIESEAQLMRRLRQEKAQAEEAAAKAAEEQQAAAAQQQQGTGQTEGIGDGGAQQGVPGAHHPAGAAGDHAAAAAAAGLSGKPRIRIKQRTSAAAAADAGGQHMSEDYSDSPAAPGSGRPRRRAAAGVAAATAAAAAAAGGAEDAWFGTAAYMESEMAHGHSRERYSSQNSAATARQQQQDQQQQQQRAAAAVQRQQYHDQRGLQQQEEQQQRHQQQVQQQRPVQHQHQGDDIDNHEAPAEGLPPHGHFHSSSTHSFTGLVEQQQQQQALQPTHFDYRRQQQPQQQQSSLAAAPLMSLATDKKNKAAAASAAARTAVEAANEGIIPRSLADLAVQEAEMLEAEAEAEEAAAAAHQQQQALAPAKLSTAELLRSAAAPVLTQAAGSGDWRSAVQPLSGRVRPEQQEAHAQQQQQSAMDWERQRLQEQWQQHRQHQLEQEQQQQRQQQQMWAQHQQQQQHRHAAADWQASGGLRQQQPTHLQAAGAPPPAAIGDRPADMASAVLAVLAAAQGAPGAGDGTLRSNQALPQALPPIAQQQQQQRQYADGPGGGGGADGFHRGVMGSGSSRGAAGVLDSRAGAAGSGGYGLDEQTLAAAAAAALEAAAAAAGLPRSWGGSGGGQ